MFVKLYSLIGHLNSIDLVKNKAENRIFKNIYEMNEMNDAVS